MPRKSSPIEVPVGINRRRFIYYSTVAGATVLGGQAFSQKTSSVTAVAKPKLKSPNEKLNVAAIGCGGKGATDIEGVFKAGQNIVALADIDANTLNKAGQKYAGAKKYRDYREMLEKEKDVDAVIVSTPDHHHAPAAIRAIKLGRHVYCQKPLAHTIWEARKLTEAARQYGVATQMGNQGHSGNGVRELCEIIWSGAIGDVREAHCWTDRPIWPQGLTRPEGADPIPSALDWDLWIGPAPMRPFKANWTDAEAAGWKRGDRRPIYHPFSWRGWWDFGCGALGDMGCHIMDAANWSLKLGAPTSVEVVETNGMTREMAPKSSVIRYEFPARGEMPALTLYWHDGGKKPNKPAELQAPSLGTNGTLFIGSKGKLLSGAYGENVALLPESKMKDYVKPPQTIPRVPENNPYEDWVRACKGGVPACSNFDYAGPFTETVLLGNLALLLGEKIQWDSKNMRVTNVADADLFIHKTYRSGWEV